MLPIYSFDTAYLSEKLLPPQLRTPKRMAWLQVLLISLQKKHNYTLEANQSFASGFSINKWSALTNYTSGNVVRFGVAVYEALKNSTGVVPIGNDAYWLKIQDDFVGADVRVLFNGGKMLFEWILNKYLNISPVSVPKIYITNNVVEVNGFYVGVDGDVKGELGTAPNQDDFLGLSYNLNPYAFTIHVPISVSNGLTTESADTVPNISNNRENIVRGIADRVNLAGIKYNVITY